MARSNHRGFCVCPLKANYLSCKPSLRSDQTRTYPCCYWGHNTAHWICNWPYIEIKDTQIRLNWVYVICHRWLLKSMDTNLLSRWCFKWKDDSFLTKWPLTLIHSALAGVWYPGPFLVSDNKHLPLCSIFSRQLQYNSTNKQLLFFLKVSPDGIMFYFYVLHKNKIFYNFLR